jgi:hypothetical protein
VNGLTGSGRRPRRTFCAADRGDLRSLRVGVDRRDPFGGDGREAAGELEHHPVIADVLARPERGQVPARPLARAGLPGGLLAG